jgi:YVTN family beta-propeller protein
MTTDPDGDSVSYRFAWGEGETSSWSGYHVGGSTTAASHLWAAPGSFAIRAQANDPGQRVSGWSLPLWIGIDERTNTAPGRPAAPWGQPEGFEDSTYLFVATAEDPDGDSVAYRFDWGDGDTSDWSVFVPNTHTAPLGHEWSTKGTYHVRVQAKDRTGALSPWSDSVDFPVWKAYLCHLEATVPTGEGPSGLAFTPDGRFLYVALNRDNAVGVLRTSDLQEVARVPVGRNPRDIAMRPDGAFAYVGIAYEDFVAVIQTSNNTVVDSIAVGRSPRELVCTEDGSKLYVAVDLAGYVLPIATATGLPLSPIEVSGYPRHLAVVPGLDLLHVSTVTQLFEISIDRDSIVRQTPTGGSVSGLAAHPEGREVYVAMGQEESLYVVQPKSLLLTDTIWVYPAAPADMAVSSDGEYLYVADRMHDAYLVVRLDDRKVVYRIGSFDAADVALSPDGRHLYVSHWADDCITVWGY